MPRTLDRELGPLKKIQPTFFDMVRLIKCKTLEYGSSKPDHLGSCLSCAFYRLPIKFLINTQLLTGGGFVWTDWGWGGVKPSASDEGETRGEAGGERLVRELEDNNETTLSVGEEEITTSDAIEQGETIKAATSVLTE